MSRSSSDIILGIDPGLRTTGYGLIQPHRGGVRLVEAGTIDGGGDALALSVRLRHLFEGMSSLFSEFNPAAAAMEQLYSHYAHPRTAIMMAHARGVLCLAAALNEKPVFDYTATEVKASLTGNGRATKDQIQRAVQHAVQLQELPEPLDVSDALAVALCHLNRATRTVDAV